MREDIYNFDEKGAKIVACSKEINVSYEYEIFAPSGLVLKLGPELSLIKGEFNDSAENIIILAGIFEANNIVREMELTTSKINIYSNIAGDKSLLVSYYITEFEKNDLDFTLKCQPEVSKYNQSILLLYSKTCRANFADNKCMVNIESYKKSYQISSVKDKIILLEKVDVNTGYYNFGFAWFENEFGKIITYKINSHNDNRIELEISIPQYLYKQKYIILSPSCDKSFITCCNKFNNAVNFRGEPTIAEHNFLKNNVV